MSDTIYIVRDPDGVVCGTSCYSEDYAWNDAHLMWGIHGSACPSPSTANGYTCETRALPSPHDAAIVAALNTPGLTDILLTFGHPTYGIECTATMGPDWRTVINQPDAATAVIHAVDAVRAKRGDTL